MSNDNSIIEILPDSGYKTDFSEVWRYRDLIWLFLKRNVRVQYRQTVFGPLWIIINPILTSVVFTFVFGRFAGVSTNGVPHILFYLLGNSMWGVFSSTLNMSAPTFRDNLNTFGKLYYPRLTVPIAQILTCLFNFAIQMVIVVAFLVVYGVSGEVTTSPLILLTPLLALQAALMGTAIGLIISSLAVKYRDLLLMVTYGLQMWLYATPIAYPLAGTGGWMYRILLINPMTPIIENFRYFATGSGSLLVWPWVISAVVTVALCALSVKMFARTERTFIDIL